MIFLSIILMYCAIQCGLNTISFLQRKSLVIRRGTLFDRTGVAAVALLNIVVITIVAAMAIGLVW